MSVVDRGRFLQCVAKSGVLEKEALDKWLAEIDADMGVKDLAKDLIRKKLATKWQGKMLAKGASRLMFGNYLLTERIAKSKFGDRFAAVHRQLSRDVVIQYLPADVCGSKETKKKLFAIGSKLADLDHPNLVHVYDVDEEKDRIYLVSESCDGKSLKDYLVDETAISCKSVTRIMSGCLKALTYSHTKGVVHGSISDSTVAIKLGGDVQILGLTQFAVENAIAEKPGDSSDDMKAVESIGNRLLGAVVEAERSGDAFSTLTSAINMICTDSVAALGMLDELAKGDSLQGLVADGMVLAPEPERAAVTPHPATAVASGGAALGSSVDGSEGNLIPFEEASEGFLTSLARRNPAALIGASVLAGLLLIGGTIFAATQLVSSPTSTQLADAELENESGDVKADDVKAESARAGKAARKKRNRIAQQKVERPNFRNGKGALSVTVGVAATGDSVTNPEANKAAIDAIFNRKTGRKEVVPAEIVQNVAAAAAPEETPDKNNKPMPPAPAPSEAEVKAAPAPEAKVVEKPTASGTKDEVLAAGADPFKKFAKLVDLPDITNKEQASFGKLILEKKHLLGAEILSTPLAHRSKPIFVMSRSADDKQAWDIGYRKKKKSDPIVIAKLQKTPNELRFMWLPEATEIPAANFLRNCRVKISTATHSHWLTLRKPFKIEGFKLSKDRGSVKLDVEIPFMPNPAALAAKLGGIEFDRLTPNNWRERAYLEPPEITPAVPARMYFHEDADRFLSLDVLGDIRKKLTLRAALVIQPSPEQPAVVLEDPRTIPQVAQQVRNMAMAAQQTSTQAQASKIKKEEKDAYKKAATKATDQAELTGYYEHVVPQLVDKDIPVTISYSLNDQHRIVLAYTVETEETKEK